MWRIMVVSLTMSSLIFVHSALVTHRSPHSGFISWHTHGSKTREEGLSQYCRSRFKYHCNSSLVSSVLTLMRDLDISHHCWSLLAYLRLRRLSDLPSGCILLPKSHLNQEMWGSLECQGTETGGQSRACPPSYRMDTTLSALGWNAAGFDWQIRQTQSSQISFTWHGHAAARRLWAHT